MTQPSRSQPPATSAHRQPVAAIIGIILAAVVGIGLFAVIFFLLFGHALSPSRAALVHQAEAEQKSFSRGETVHAGPLDLKVVAFGPYQPTTTEVAKFTHTTDATSFVKVSLNVTVVAKNQALTKIADTGWAAALNDITLNGAESVLDTVDHATIYSSQDIPAEYAAPGGVTIDYTFPAPVNQSDVTLAYTSTIFTKLLPIVGTEGAPRAELVYTVKL